MSKICPGRSLSTDLPPTSGYVGEPYLSPECLQCIGRALVSSTSKITTIDTYDKGLALARSFVGDETIPADDFDGWSSLAMKHPGQGAIRYAIIESGFDLGLGYGQSYVDGSETIVKKIEFYCSNE